MNFIYENTKILGNISKPDKTPKLKPNDEIWNQRMFHNIHFENKFLLQFQKFKLNLIFISNISRATKN